MGAAPGEEDLVLGGELGERHRVVKTGRETIGRRESLGEADLAGSVEIDQAGIHPTQKPVALIEGGRPQLQQTKDVVLDPFAGSGSTLIACEKSGSQARAGRAGSQVLRHDRPAVAGVDGEVAVLHGDARDLIEVAAGRA